MRSIHHRLFTESVDDSVGIADYHTNCVTNCVSKCFTYCVVVTVAFNNEFTDVIVNALSNT